MKRFYFLIIVLLAGGTAAFSQTSNCTQVLRLVRSTYEQGRLHELPAITEGCLKAPEGKGFTNVEKRETYRFLTLAYIYLEEPEKADEMMLKLLNTDHFYKVNQSVDPAEFIALFNKFRTEPVFRAGVKLAPNYTMPAILKNYYVGSQSAGMGSFSPATGIQLGVVFEKDFFKKFTLAPELFFLSARNFTYTNPRLGIKDEDPTMSSSSHTAIVKQSWMDLNVIVQYKLSTNAWNWYGGLGPGLNYISSSSNQLNTLLGNGYTVTGSPVIDTKSFNRLNYSLVALVGMKYKIGEIYVNGEIRYQYGLNNVINPSTRSQAESLYDYGFQYNDFRINTLSLSIGILYPYFNPIKLIK